MIGIATPLAPSAPRSEAISAAIAVVPPPDDAVIGTTPFKAAGRCASRRLLAHLLVQGQSCAFADATLISSSML